MFVLYFFRCREPSPRDPPCVLLAREDEAAQAEAEEAREKLK